MKANASKEWATRLGLSTSPLFGTAVEGSERYTALLDGIAGSFTMSDFGLSAYAGGEEQGGETDWSWSALMRHHVTVDRSEVQVSRSDSRATDRFSKASVEKNLEDFFTVLEKAPPPQLPDAVDHIIRCFQKLRAEVVTSAERQLASFLALTALRLEHLQVPASDMPGLLPELHVVASKYRVDLDLIDDKALSTDLARRFYEELLEKDTGGRNLHLDLTIRHASGELFQAAHLAPEPAPAQRSMFGLTNVRVRPHSLKGVAYTPLGLARSLAEEGVSRLNLEQAKELVILDPACGSGTFLIETLAALARVKWSGKVKLVGFDISSSAIASARFALACANQENTNISVESVLRLGDFLDPESPIVTADLTIMNPPYMSWGDLTSLQRVRLRNILGASYRGRPDLSMAFVDRAVKIAPQHGIVATLLPVGVLAGEYAARWRAELAELAQPAVIGVLGEHSLFRFATVNIAAVVLERQRNDETITMLWSSETPGSASASMRALRKQRELGVASVSMPANSPWTLYSTSTVDLKRRPTWLPAPGLLGPQLSRFTSMWPGIVSDLFKVRLGVRAGDREAFVLSKKDFNELPNREKMGFRSIAEKDDIRDGRITSTRYLFVAGEEITDESELLNRFPTYAARFLLPVQERLSRRSRIAQHKWWLLAEARNTWKNSSDPRIVSRRWVRNNGYAVDSDGTFAIVQGYAWFPLPVLRQDLATNPKLGTIVDLLRLYCIMFSSDIFYQILREFSTNASGGQIDLQQKYLNQVPVPLLASKLLVDRELEGIVDSFDLESFPDLNARNLFAARCYDFISNDL